MVTSVLAPASLPADQRVYAIGDVHGCADRLHALHSAIADDLAARPIAHALVVHLGDVIDRGPDSAAAIAAAMAPRALPAGVRAVTLMGNHEAMMLAALAAGTRDIVEAWLANGGGATLASWGLSWRDGPVNWAHGIPAGQLGFLRSLPLTLHLGGYLLVHAGLRPGVTLAAQTENDLLWIREPFLSTTAPMPVVAVHGHTVEERPTLLPHRIGIDTGAVLGGPLTCAVLEGDRLTFLEA